MSSISRDLESFLEVVDKVAGAARDLPASLPDARSALSGAGLHTLGQDTADEEDALVWLTNTVRVAAQASPSLGFLLAARYAADRALGAESAELEPTFCLSPGSRAVAATGLGPETLVVADTGQTGLMAVPWVDVAESAVHEPRTGLHGAQLVSVTVPELTTGSPADAAGALAVWDLLTGAVLVGVARRAVMLTQTYVMERQQFGAPIGSFGGLRAMVGDMDLKATGMHALLDACTDRAASSENVAAVAGRATIEICLDAIQAHGGYGYVDEYPVAGLLRDAISIQARAGGRRLHVARVAERGLGSRGAGRS